LNITVRPLSRAKKQSASLTGAAVSPQSNLHTADFGLMPTDQAEQPKKRRQQLKMVLALDLLA
jgi:hypothetical protein